MIRRACPLALTISMSHSWVLGGTHTDVYVQCHKPLSNFCDDYTQKNLQYIIMEPDLLRSVVVQKIALWPVGLPSTIYHNLRIVLHRPKCPDLLQHTHTLPLAVYQMRHYVRLCYDSHLCI